MGEEQNAIRVERRDGGLYLHVRGEVDLDMVDRFIAEMDQQLVAPCPVVMDLFGVTFADSSLIRVIGHIDRAIRPHGHRIQIHGAGAQVRRLLELTKLDTIVDLAPE